MVPNGKSTRNSDLKHAQAIGRQRKAANIAATPDPGFQKAVVLAAEDLQRQHEDTLDSGRLTKAMDIVLAGAVEHLNPHSAIVRSGDKTYRVEQEDCPCGDSTHRGVRCKHSLAVAIDTRVQAMLNPPGGAPLSPEALTAFEPLRGHWSEREPRLLHTVKFRDPELGVEHMVVVRADCFDELWRDVREVMKLVKAKRDRHAETADDDDISETADDDDIPETPATNAVPSCPDHFDAMRESRYGGYHCPVQLDDGSYCKRRAKG